MLFLGLRLEINRHAFLILPSHPFLRVHHNRSAPTSWPQLEAPSEKWTSQLYRANSAVGLSRRRKGMGVSTFSIQLPYADIKTTPLHGQWRYPPHQQHQLPTRSSQQSLIRQPSLSKPTQPKQLPQHAHHSTQVSSHKPPNPNTALLTNPKCPSPPASPTTPPPPAGGPALTPPSPRRW